MEAKKGCASMPANLRRIALMVGLEAQALRDDFAQVGVTLRQPCWYGDTPVLHMLRSIPNDVGRLEGGQPPYISGNRRPGSTG